MEKKLTITKVSQGKNNEVYEDGIRELTIKPLKLYQVTAFSKLIHDFVKEINENENVAGTLSGIFDGLEDGMDQTDILRAVSAQFVKDGIGSIGMLLEVAPKSVFEMVATLAHMSLVELEYQEVDTFFDILDATLEVNHFAKVVKRLNLSGTLLQKSMGWAKVVSEATAPKVIK